MSYLILLRASELSAEDNSRMYAVYYLGGGDVTFYTDERQVEARWRVRTSQSWTWLRCVSEAPRATDGERGDVLMATGGVKRWSCFRSRTKCMMGDRTQS